MRKTIVIGISLLFFIGIAFQASARKIHCWDLNENYECDIETEDMNNDGKCNFRDCETEEQCYAVQQTGQNRIVEDGDDGYWEKGIAPPSPRFIDNEDGTITDTFTNLMWTQSAQHFGIGTDFQMNWSDGITACNTLVFADYDDWRMPNVREMQSIMDYGYYDPALKPGHPFTDIPLVFSTYWSSTSHPLVDYDAFHVPLKNATIAHVNKDGLKYIWPVRGGN